MNWCSTLPIDSTGAIAGPLSFRISSAFDWRLIRDSLPKKQQRRWIEVLDFGVAGNGHSRLISIRNLEQTSSTDRRKSIWLAAFSASASTEKRENLRILELGTCLGAGALSLILGSGGRCHYVGLEGSPDLARMAKCRIRRAAPHVPVDIHVGPFETTLPLALKGDLRFDLVFLDGHHDGRVLLDQWDQIQSRLSEDAWILIDDIRWSGDMHAAWNVLTKKEGVLAFDLFRMGALRRCTPSCDPDKSSPSRVPLSLSA